MDKKMMDKLDPDLQELWQQLVRLHHARRDQTHAQHNRINPFVEDLFDWKERGAYLFGEGRNITIYNSTIVNGKVDIGDNSWIGPYCSLDGGEAGLQIGSYCSISLGVQLLTHDTARWALSGGKASYEHASTEIGDCCFIGSLAVVTRGVRVGRHCVIGAGAVVTGNVQDLTIVAGVPAKEIGKVRISPTGAVEFDYGSRG